jgi:short-subunit dehydrogenase
MHSFENKWAIITGASSGIGKEFAQQLASQKCNLILVARREQRLQEIQQELQEKFNVQVEYIVADLSEVNSYQSIYDQAVQHKNIHLLINNAGVGHYGPTMDHQLSDHMNTVNVNISAVMSLTYLFTEHMQTHKEKSYICNVASVAAFQGVPYFGVYCGTKKFVRDFTESLEFEFKGSNISYSCLCPGGTYTEFLEHSKQDLKEAGHANMMSAKEVVEIGIKGILQEKGTVVTGFKNLIASQLNRFIPGGWARWIGHQAMHRSVNYRHEKGVL